MSERVLVIVTPSSCDRYALPSVGAVSVGSAAKNAITLDASAELALDHASFLLDHAVAVQILDDDASLARGDDEAFAPLKRGQTIELASGDRIRLGAAEIALAIVDPVRPVARVLHRQTFERWMTKRLSSASVVVARLRFARAPEELAEAVARTLRPGDAIAALSPLEYAALLADVTPTEAKRTLAELGRTFPELSFGVAEPREAEPAKILALAAERIAFHTEGARLWISDDPEMRVVDKLIDRAAAGMAHVLLMGETGTGKDVCAQLIHDRSSRKNRPFVKVSCVEVSDTFAHDEAGPVLARARGGTLHIDEVLGLSPRAQLGLGYALDEAESAGLDVRFIASSNQDITAAVEAGQFRKDLYYRLDQLEIGVPPLRARRGDIMPLAELFLAGRGSISGSARAALEAYAWPGNVRELKNAVERAVLLAGNAAITLDHLPRALRATPAADAPALAEGPVSLKSEIAALEKRRILEALRKYPTQREAAEALEMPMRTFLNRLDSLGIQRARGGGGSKTSDDDE